MLKKQKKDIQENSHSSSLRGGNEMTNVAIPFKQDPHVASLLRITNGITMFKILAIGVLVTMLIVLSPNTFAKNEDSGSGKSESSGKNEDNRGQGGETQGKKIEVGKVEEIKNNVLKVEDKKSRGKSQVLLDNATQIVSSDSGKNRGQGGKIKKDDLVAIISSDSGKMASDGGKLKKALKVFVKEASTSATSKRRAVQGVVTSVSGNVITLSHQIHRDRVSTVLYNAATAVKGKDASGSASLVALQPGVRIVAVGDLVDGGILAKRIHIIPGKAQGVFGKNPVSTPSASTIASPAASASSSAAPLPTTDPTTEPLPTP